MGSENNWPDRSMRVSTKERDEAVQKLEGSFAEGKLNEEEFSERTSQALQAKTRGELDDLIKDLGVAQLPLAKISKTTVWQKPVPHSLAIFSNVEHRGHWVVAGHCQVISVFGSCILDLREALLTSPLTTIELVVVFGNVEVIVPPGVHVKSNGVPLFSNWSHSKSKELCPKDAPTVQIRGMAIFGSVDVRVDETSRKRSPGP